MTIKPVVAPSQKRVTVEEKKEAHTHVEPGSNLSQTSGRSTATHTQCRAGQSPQRRNEVYDDLTRHRRSPHKTNRSKCREHHHHNKRERVDREKHPVTGVSVSSKCNSPHIHGVPAPPGVAVSNTVGVSNVNAVAGVVVGGNSSPAHVMGGNKSPEHLSGIPVVLGCQSPKSQTAVTHAAANLLKAVEDTYSGYNSGDEHLQPKEGAITADEWQQRDEQFAKCMVERGYVLKPVEEDGACLFRAISLQIYGDEEMHDVIRQHTMDYIYKNREYFCHFVTEDINSYIKRKRRKDSHGNHIEIQAMSEIYSRPVEVYCYKPTPINIFNSEQQNNGYAPLRLSYQRGSHYNAIIDPYNATVGVGLGLAGYKPELQTKEATRLSEQLEIEQTMFEDKLKTTDWEATNEAIEEQIARESYLQWCRENLHKSRATATAASTSATVTSAEAASDSEASPSKYSTQRNIASSSTITAALSATATMANDEPLTASANSAAGSGMATAFGLSPKSLNSLAHNLKKNSTPVSCELDFDSDDTDMSSTSSIGTAGGASPTAVLRAKKSKKRSGSVRGGSKKRRRELGGAEVGEVLTRSSVGKSPKQERGNLSPAVRPKSRASTPDTEPQPGTSKQSTKGTPEKQMKEVALVEGGESKASTSASVTNCKGTKELASTSASKEPLSSFYQELLEASYAGDGFGQLSESEMLQRAIQMSTQDYIEDQKRKYLYGP